VDLNWSLKVLKKKTQTLNLKAFTFIKSDPDRMVFLTKLRFENTKTHKIKKQALYFACFLYLFVTPTGLHIFISKFT